MKRTVQIVLAFILIAGEPARAEVFDSAGVKIHYVVAGKGDPVILIHGLMASAQINWEWPGIISELAKNHRVVALDCRGHGGSDKPVRDDQYGVNMVEDVVRLMDHLQIKRAQVVGYSMGGMIAMKMMVMHPQRVRSAVLGGMGWMENGNLFPGYTNASQNAIEACIRGFKGLAVSAESVRNIKTPFIVIVGDLDPLRLLYVEPLHQLRPDVRIVLVAGAGHLNCIFQPAFKADIKAFVDGQSIKIPAG
jgi:pimeloyl-ACP methyl ester carboxylesterase